MNNPIDNVSEVGSQKAVAAASYGASISTAAGGAFTVNELALWGGLLLALLTFIVNWVYQSRKETRDAKLAEQQERINDLREKRERMELERLEMEGRNG
ncbi:phage holin family protein [Shewanella xiamenensis]|uniref:phage holin family protein n=1 Tax=Shewanella xiamenensis TaxID=332186 RepID=UPI00217D4073|nr:phage holin family protein [Shewanella xiamenensis]MCT8857551.1 phage holin family protein [Shewanella xiamenensis]UWG66430.1 phage holin family protein [Shewanella xiamenensis]